MSPNLQKNIVLRVTIAAYCIQKPSAYGSAIDPGPKDKAKRQDKNEKRIHDAIAQRPA